MPVGHRSHQVLQYEAGRRLNILLVAGGAEPTALAGKGQQVFVLAVIAADAGKPPLQIPTLQELVDHLGDDGAQDAVARLVKFFVTFFELVIVPAGAHGVRGSYEVEPYHLAAYHGNWYLLALNRAAGRLETFALSRCDSMSGTGEYFTPPAGFDARAFFKDAFGISQAKKPWRVRLLFAREVATYIRERTWHPSQRLRARRDGSLELRLTISGRKELTRWVLSWMPHVRVLAPPELRERVRQRMRQGLAWCR